MSRVALVIPGKNCAATLAACLEAVAAIENPDDLAEVVFVDDGSTDDSGEIAGRHGARVLVTEGLGPGGARNVGWRAVKTDLVWFVDSDCVPEPGALAQLLAHIDDAEVVAVGGSYANARPDSWLARLIHAEIRQRHLRMPAEVDFLGGFNVLYQRAALDSVDGFDEVRFNGPGAPGAEDVDLSFRLRRAGHRLRFTIASVVAHHHPTRLGRYLRSQRVHGDFAARLYKTHPARGVQNSYSDAFDHLQPIVAAVFLALLPVTPWWPQAPAMVAALLVGLQLPMALGLARRLRSVEMLLFVPVGFLRSLWRAVGLSIGVLA